MNRLRAYREELGLTQVELAQRLGINQNLLSYYETGKRNPKGSVLFRIARFLGCPLGKSWTNGTWTSRRKRPCSSSRGT